MKAAAGIYWGKLKEVGIGASGKNKTPRLRLIFTVDLKANENGDWEKVAEPLERSVNFFLTDAALEWTEEKLAALGFDGNYAEPDIRSFDPDLSSAGTQLSCTIRKGEGEKSFEEWQISKLDDIRSDGLDPLPGQDLDRLAARYKQNQANTRTPTSPPGASAVIKATPNQVQAPSAPPMREPEDDASVPEEDIPF